MTELASDNTQLNRAAAVAASFVALTSPLVMQAFAVGWLPIEKLIQIIPDDAFYYLILARNKASGGLWTFDHQAPATGFHLAYGYLLLMVDTLWPGLGLETLTRIVIWSAVGLVAAAFAALLGAVSGRMRSGVTAGLLLLLATPIGRMQCIFMMETPLVMACAALLCAVIATGHTGRVALASAVAIGIVGSLSRTDFGLLPAALSIAALLLREPSTRGRVSLRISGAALGGSILGLLLVSLHSYLVSGALLQASVSIKRHWGAVHGYDLGPALALLARLWDPLTPSLGVFCAVMAVLAVALVLAVRGRHYGEHPSHQVITLGAVMFVPLAIVFYGFDAVGAQLWYFGGFFVPLAIAAGAIVAASPAWLRVSVTGCAAALAIFSSLTPIVMLWPSQVSSMAGGMLLRGDAAATPVGGWNSGIASWFSGRDLINLDGLVNDEILPFVLTDQLEGYLDQRGIRYVLDYPSTVRFDRFEELLGMSCGRLTRRLEPIRHVENDRRFWWNGTPMTLYRVLPAPPQYDLGEPILFDVAGDAARFQGCGWEFPDAQGARIDAPGANLILPLAPVAAGDLQIEVVATSDGPATLGLSSEASPLAHWQLVAGPNLLTATIPAIQAERGFLRLDFTKADAINDVSLSNVTVRSSIGGAQ